VNRTLPLFTSFVSETKKSESKSRASPLFLYQILYPEWRSSGLSFVVTMAAFEMHPLLWMVPLLLLVRSCGGQGMSLAGQRFLTTTDVTSW
jgi:hypothetical protein